MMTWFRANIAIRIGIILLFAYVPVLLFSGIPAIGSGLVLGFTAVVYLLLWIWVGLYSESMSYELREDEIDWKRGIWSRTTGIVSR